MIAADKDEGEVVRGGLGAAGPAEPDLEQGREKDCPGLGECAQGTPDGTHYALLLCEAARADGKKYWRGHGDRYSTGRKRR